MLSSVADLQPPSGPAGKMVRGKPRRTDDRTRGRRPPSPPRFAPRSSSYNRPSNRSDSWRPGNGGRDTRDGPHGRNDDNFRSSDSYRPQAPRGDFTFRFDKPAGIPDFPPNGYGNDGRGIRRDRRGGQRRPGRRWQPPPHPSERALINGATLNLPEERLEDSEGGAKFRDLDELSDDDELEMEISSQSSQSDSEEPSRKKARTTGASNDADAAPKWSNPDPYTAMPCPDETTRKKRDVVKLIRKARVEAASKLDAPAEAEDFLSFDLSDEENDDEDDDHDDQPGDFPPPPSQPPPPHPPIPTGPSAGRDSARGTDSALQPPDRSGPLGSRKRTANDEIKPPDYGQLKKVSMKPSKGSILSTWLQKKNENPCPWTVPDHAGTHNMAFRYVIPQCAQSRANGGSGPSNRIFSPGYIRKSLTFMNMFDHEILNNVFAIIL